jgi:hypothetical protein
VLGRGSIWRVRTARKAELWREVDAGNRMTELAFCAALTVAPAIGVPALSPALARLIRIIPVCSGNLFAVG